jgi:hypothetical protein
MVDVQDFKASATGQIVFFERSGEWTAECEDALGWQYASPFRSTQMEVIHDLKVLALQRGIKLEVSSVPVVVRRGKETGRARERGAA